MKTYCKPKHTDISNPDFNRAAVHEAFENGKLRRYDFRGLLVEIGGISFSEIESERREHRCNKIVGAIDRVCNEMTRRIRDHDLKLRPVRQFRRVDGISRKVRDLCQESPEQQVAEYILVHALAPLFRAKLLPCQFGSVPGRGQVAGKRRIERIVRLSGEKALSSEPVSGRPGGPPNISACISRSAGAWWSWRALRPRRPPALAADARRAST